MHEWQRNSLSIKYAMSQERILVNSAFEEDGRLKAVLTCGKSCSGYTGTAVCFVTKNLGDMIGFGLGIGCQPIENGLQKALGMNEHQASRFDKTVSITRNLEQKCVFFQPIRTQDGLEFLMKACTVPIFESLHDDIARYILVIFEPCNNDSFHDSSAPSSPCQLSQDLAAIALTREALALLSPNGQHRTSSPSTLSTWRRRAMVRREPSASARIELAQDGLCKATASPSADRPPQDFSQDFSEAELHYAIRGRDSPPPPSDGSDVRDSSPETCECDLRAGRADSDGHSDSDDGAARRSRWDACVTSLRTRSRGRRSSSRAAGRRGSGQARRGGGGGGDHPDAGQLVEG
jgi:hypothetical protein